MTNNTVRIKSLTDNLDETFEHLLILIERFDMAAINAIPFSESWTAAQVANHITKSNKSISKALLLKGIAINRANDERVAELKSVFLNFNTKLKSPDFILPDKDTFDKYVVIANLAHSINKIKEIAESTELSSMIKHPIFGDITKYEILHFVLYHTQRHIHQLEIIYEALKHDTQKTNIA